MHLRNMFTKQYSLLTLLCLLSLSSLSAQASQSGYATRYWDGCKAHCSWQDNVSGEPVKTCNINNQINTSDTEIASACDGGDAYTCWDMSPRAVSDTLSYGYAAVPATENICGKCYLLTFTGTGKYNDNEQGAVALKAAGKQMIVMATNIGYDVAGGQFDILIPGGGVGAFNACSTQWGVSSEDLGAQYGGFLTDCQSQYGYNDTETLKSCVQNKCDTIFDKTGMEDLKAGCDWYVDWFEMADNPNLEYEEVSCPEQLVSGAYLTDDSNDENTDDDSEQDSGSNDENTDDDSEQDSGSNDENTDDDSEQDSGSNDENTDDDSEQDSGSNDENTEDDSEQDSGSNDENTDDDSEQDSGSNDENTEDDSEQDSGSNDENTGGDSEQDSDSNENSDDTSNNESDDQESDSEESSNQSKGGGLLGGYELLTMLLVFIYRRRSVSLKKSA